jgi:hypothetical protein
MARRMAAWVVSRWLASWGMLQPVVQEGLQAAARVGEVQACGLLVEVALLGVGDGEAAAEDQAARLAGCLWCFPCARSAGRPPLREIRHDQGINRPGAVGDGGDVRMGKTS